MPSPFPGMDPYLERPSRWHPFHTRLVVRLADAVEPLLPERYYVSVEERTYIIDPDDPDEIRLPDVAVIDQGRPATPRASGTVTTANAVEVFLPAPETLRERYLEIRDLEAGESVVTVVEILSPINKRPGPGRDDYTLKRGTLLYSPTHMPNQLVEVDLLRAGPRLAALGAPERADYSILISRSHTRPRGVLLPFMVRDPIPRFPLPLRRDDVEPEVSLGDVLTEVYDLGRYDQRIDYRIPPEPPLSQEDEAWADELLKEKGLR